jgi:hypothetical protein
MTYNFDPDLWYENHHRLIEARHAAGELDDVGLREALAKLEAEFEAMLTRLDGTYQLPRDASDD